MSVMEATEWFNARSLDQFCHAEPAEIMVLGIYPFEFVHEALRKAGAPFFPIYQ